MESCMICGVDKDKALYARCARELKRAGIKTINCAPLDGMVHLWIERRDTPTKFYGVSVADIGRDAMKSRELK